MKIFSLLLAVSLKTSVKASVAAAPVATAGLAASPAASVVVVVLLAPIPSKWLSPAKKSVVSTGDPLVVDKEYLPTTILEAD